VVINAREFAPRPEDIAHVILFLCSDDAKVMHDAAVPVCGGS
jgi:hypothetical protein